MNEVVRYFVDEGPLSAYDDYVRRTYPDRSGCGFTQVVLASDYDALTARVAELEAALHTYGEHSEGCAVYEPGRKLCDCGYIKVKVGPSHSDRSALNEVQQFDHEHLRQPDADGGGQ